ncbi:hypothetical protein AAFF_G00404400 [Aldrovandia affinis]|uniref:Fibronectin type-III domain-containing protein n=1 Tax=Aldrovandia affinis TaxID=143900 RepID=A0AAD7T7Y2_9TELE|nr:hypothetical protein AAFF_G00404400 [Aldrovandia affinis]
MEAKDLEEQSNRERAEQILSDCQESAKLQTEEGAIGAKGKRLRGISQPSLEKGPLDFMDSWNGSHMPCKTRGGSVWNESQQIPPWEYLSKLALDNNKISQVEAEALNGLSDVKEFLIHGNQLADIPAGLLDPLERVEELDFSHNHISNVHPSAFKQLKHLKILKLQTQDKVEKTDPLQKERKEPPVVTDPCELSHRFILNVTVGQVSSSSATIHWAAREHSGSSESEVYFRVLFDRFGQQVRFHRFVYVRDRAHQVTLQELSEDSSYMVCVEGVVGGAVCPVASRDHCVGVVTLQAEHSGANIQVIVKVMLGMNIFLLLLVGGTWIGCKLRRRLKCRKSNVNSRHMFNTRQPLCSMATTVSKDFTTYQVRQPRMRTVDEANTIMFPCDRFLSDHSSMRDEGLQRFPE